MKDLNDEIQLTINIIQSVDDECVYASMRKHLDGLLEIKRNELQKRLDEQSWSEPVKHDASPYNSPIKLYGYITDEIKPLTAEELEAGGWVCKDVSEECAIALNAKGLKVFNWKKWGYDCQYDCCLLNNTGSISRATSGSLPYGLRQIKRTNGEFYWAE